MKHKLLLGGMAAVAVTSFAMAIASRHDCNQERAQWAIAETDIRESQSRLDEITRNHSMSAIDLDAAKALLQATEKRLADTIAAVEPTKTALADATRDTEIVMASLQVDASSLEESRKQNTALVEASRILELKVANQQKAISNVVEKLKTANAKIDYLNNAYQSGRAQ